MKFTEEQLKGQYKLGKRDGRRKTLKEVLSILEEANNNWGRDLEYEKDIEKLRKWIKEELGKK